ncbi:MAG: hypothetical protein U0X39_02350 [Bacteroidales bacterium]
MPGIKKSDLETRMLNVVSLFSGCGAWISGSKVASRYTLNLHSKAISIEK